MIIRHARGKVNLMLNINEKMLSGYHKMQSIFLFVDDLYDELIFDLSKCFNKNSAYIKNIHNDDNLIHRAYEILRGYCHDIFIPDVRIKKNIPIGGGLAGGSTDASCFINFVLDFNKISIKEKMDFMKYCEVLGSDIPVCLYHYIHGDKLLLLEGIGKSYEIRCISSSDDIDGLKIIIVNDNDFLSTRDVFLNFKEKFDDKIIFSDNISLEFLKNSRNILERSALKLCHNIKNILEDLKMTNPIFYRMSGSGSSCFGVYDRDVDIDDISRLLKKKYAFVTTSTIKLDKCV